MPEIRGDDEGVDIGDGGSGGRVVVSTSLSLGRGRATSLMGEPSIEGSRSVEDSDLLSTSDSIVVAVGEGSAASSTSCEVSSSIVSGSAFSIAPGEPVGDGCDSTGLGSGVSMEGITILRPVNPAPTTAEAMADEATAANAADSEVATSLRVRALTPSRDNSSSSASCSSSSVVTVAARSMKARGMGLLRKGGTGVEGVTSSRISSMGVRLDKE